MQIGKIKWFSAKLGYGFLLNECGDELFFHYDVIHYRYKAVRKNSLVEFEALGNTVISVRPL